MIQPEEIINFWFSDKVSKLWFNSTPDFDREILQKYESVFQAAIGTSIDDWMTTAEGVLAMVIVLDQFPLNMYRGKPECFSGEIKSRKVANIAIDNNWDQQFEKFEKAFLYMPFMHSEDLQDQDKSISLFTAAGLEDNLRFAQHHREIIRQFGRFPHRNAILGRASTQEELDYLNSKNAFLG